jgi:hypothetical protein
MAVRGYPTYFRKALAISIVAALCSGMAVPASAMPNMPHLFAKHEVATCGGDVAHVSHPYRNSSRGYSGDAAGCYGHETRASDDLHKSLQTRQRGIGNQRALSNDLAN